ncbi:hypothetical protein ABTY98_39785 [Streptomyces sp. NPDC096040]|uniref:hypothetical protein n=1 Tax=Streptomyces sp. NPDC096040 TaxID=3155541 RepID=UPI00332ADFA3
MLTQPSIAVRVERSAERQGPGPHGGADFDAQGRGVCARRQEHAGVLNFGHL